MDFTWWIYPNCVNYPIIKQLRKERNLTQTKLGEKMGVKKSAVALYEKGRDNLTLETLTKLSNALGLVLKTSL